MKKVLFSLFLSFCAVAYSTAQQDAPVLPAPTPLTVEVTHWSFGVMGGANYFRISPAAFNRTDKINLMGGANLEYTINPLFGIGVEYNYNPYSRDYNTGTPVIGKLEGHTHDGILYGSINLSNLLTPYRVANKFNAYGNFGVGASYYFSSLNNGPTAKRFGPLMNFGLNLEYNVSKVIALGVQGQYRFYNRADLGGVSTSRGNCDALIATMGLRFKFNAIGAKQHARNISMIEYYPRPAQIVMGNTINRGNSDETMARLKAVEQENTNLNNKISKLQSDQKGLSNAAEQKNANLNEKLDNLKKDQKELSTVKENTMLRSEIQRLEDGLKTLATQKEGILSVSFENIEFKSGSSELTSNSYALLDQIVPLLKTYEWNILSVIGHTDDVGSDKSNQLLSELRAKSVKVYLTSQSVPAAKVSAIGLGESKPIALNTTAEGRQTNRRVEFLIKK